MTSSGAHLTAAESDDPDRLIFPLVAEPAPRQRWVRTVVAGAVILGLLSMTVVVAVEQLWRLPGESKWAVVASAADTQQRTANRSSVAASVFLLEPGTCLRDFDGGTVVQAVPVVSCAIEHQVEVIATLTMPHMTWPGRLAMDEFAVDHCVPAIYDAGVEPTRSLKWSYYGPSESSWRFRGDRTVTCIVVSDDGPLTGSLIGESSDRPGNEQEKTGEAWERQ